MMKGKERFLAACKGLPVDRPPVWLMRQAGRYLPEYMAIKEKHSFEEVCRTPALAREVAEQPFRRFELDAAILFSDILVVPEAMGMDVSFPDGGPRLAPPLRSLKDIDRLVDPDVEQALGYVGQALQAIRQGVGEDKALIGFSGAPYTLATYMITGGEAKRRPALRARAYSDPGFIHELLERLSSVLLRYLRMQIEQGADALQLFDTWAGELSPLQFEKLVLPTLTYLVDGLRETKTPIIYYINGIGPYLEPLSEIGVQVLGIDYRTPLSVARKHIAGRSATQGNLDPAELFAPEAHIRRRVREMAAELDGQSGHIFNLGHGIWPNTPIEGVAAFVDEITKLGA